MAFRLQSSIVGIIWLTCGFFSTCRGVFCLVRDIKLRVYLSTIQSDFAYVVVCALACLAGYGVLRHRAWGRVVFVIAGILVLLHFASYLMMVGLDYGVASYKKAWLVVFFTIYSIFVVVITRVCNPMKGAK